MTTNHTPTPWTAARTPKGNAYIAATGIGNVVDAGALKHGDAAHIVACVNAHAALTARVAEGIARVAELSDTLAAIGAADEQPGHPHYLSKARMAALAREALRGAA